VKCSVFRYLNCLELKLLACLNCEGEGSNLQRNLVMI